MKEHKTLLARAADAVEDRRWTTVLLAILCIGLLGWTFRQAVGGDLFRLQRIVVHGVDAATADQVRAFAAEPEGRYIWRVDVERVARRVRLLPWARAVRVRRQLPDTLVIDVHRDQAVAMAVLRGRLVDVAATGRLVATRVTASPKVLVQGVVNAADMKLAMAARRSFAALRSEEELSEILIHATGVSVFDRAGIEYRLGRSRFDERLRNAERVRAMLKERRVRVDRMLLDDDLHPDRVVVRRGS